LPYLNINGPRPLLHSYPNSTINRSFMTSGSHTHLLHYVPFAKVLRSIFNRPNGLPFLLEQGLLHLAQTHYPAQVTTELAPKATDEKLANCARHMWATFRTMRSHTFTATGIVTAWRQWATFSKAHREHKQRAKAKSKERKYDLLRTAQEAAQQGNMHKVWQVVKTLAPKSKRKQLQLHKDGHIMTPQAELDWIIEEFGSRYGARPMPSIGKTREHPPLQIQAFELWHQLDHLPVRKAVPCTAAPSVLWKACSTEVTAFVTDQVNHDWEQEVISIEQDWADASVALLPKPKNKNDTPNSWRPIGIQHPLGKCLMSVVISRAKQNIHNLIYFYPQTAYVPHRNTFTALKRVYAHCSYVRDMASRHRLTPHQQQAGLTTISSSGGLQICMDLSSAFDLVSWSSIREALELAEIDVSVQEILLLWLGQVRYIFRHKNLEQDIWPSWGLRQGCCGSPVLWAAFTALLARAIDQKLQNQWCKDHATLYADDTHLKWTFTKIQEFDQAIGELRCVFAIFRRLGMKVNNDKTQAILSVTGPLKHKIHKLYVRKQGNDRRLLLSPGDPNHWVLLVDQAEYLGLIISYHHYEKQSVQHRLAKANHRRWALASILHTKRMSIAYKLQLWQSCALSTMMYALHCLCLSAGNVHSLQKTIMKHVRAIVANQAFLTGTTHDEIMKTYHIRMHGLDPDMMDFFGEYQEMEEMPGPMQPTHAPRNPFVTPNKRRRDPFGTSRPTPSPFRPPHYQQGPHPPRAPHRDPLLFTLAKTVLKQQEELQVLRQDTSYILFLRAGEHSVLSHLYQTAVKFKQQQEADPGWKLGHVPLRMVLAVSLFKELIDRLNLVLASQEKLQKVTDSGWRNESGWRFQRWNPTLKHLEIDQARPSIPDDQLLDHLATILQCLKHPIVNRFRCKRKLAETMTSQATFVMDVSLRSQFSTTLWDTLRILQNNAIFQLIGTSYKTESLGRSPMEQRIRDLLYGQQ
ncbi:unnamed protein product, partial [Symbiodinium sp. CCMP2592]